MSPVANDISGVKSNSGSYVVTGIAGRELFCFQRPIFLF